MPFKPTKRAVFLDRDGVINQSIVRHGKPYAPASLAEVEILPDVPEALALLSDIGYLLIVVTNQPDVARQTTTQQSVEEIHAYLGTHLPIDEFSVCYHVDEDHCACRKPAPGQLIAAARKHQIDLSQSYMIGDRWRDVEAGQNAGCQTIFIDYGYAEKQPSTMNFRVHTLKEATHIILGRETSDEIN